MLAKRTFWRFVVSLLSEAEKLRTSAYDADFDRQQTAQQSHNNGPILKQQLHIEAGTGGDKEKPQQHTPEGSDVCFLRVTSLSLSAKAKCDCLGLPKQLCPKQLCKSEDSLYFN